MAGSPTTADVLALITAWGGPVEPAVSDALHRLDVDAVMRALTEAVADLLASGPRDVDHDDDAAASVLVERAVALARTGQMATAAALAEPVVGDAGLPPMARAALLRTTLLVHASAANVADVDRIVDGLDRSRYPPAQLRRVDATRRFVHVLRGDPVARTAALAAPVPAAVTPETGTLPLVMPAIASMLAGDGARAVELAERAADGYRALARRRVEELASVDIWPTQFRLYTSGRDDARRHLDGWRGRTAESGQAWVEAYHQASSAMLALADGQLDDAAAELDAALESAEDTGQGWTSSIIGMRERLDVVRGDLDVAAERVQRFRATGRPDSLGLHWPDLALAEVAAARAAPDDALGRSWSAAIAEDNRLWMLLAGLDHLRAARRLGAGDLARDIVSTLAELDAPPGLAHTPAFARAALDGDVGAAVSAVDRCRATASVLDAARLAGDAAHLASEADPSAARGLAARATEELEALGAAGEARAVMAELRERGVRTGVRGRRARPTTGWASLTPTEGRIVELVAGGATGPEIGRTLYISPRTVQTHVSHAMGKLGVANRLELAAAHAARAAHAVRSG